MEQRLLNKVALVTGAGQGLGKAVALRLAHEGADIVVAEYNPETAAQTVSDINALGRKSLNYPIDLSDVTRIQPMVVRPFESRSGLHDGGSASCG